MRPQVGEQSVNVARNAVLAGFPESVPGVTIDRQCGSSQQAVNFAVAGVIAGHYDVVVAGGVESMSRVPMFSNAVGGDGPFGPLMNERYDNGLVNQGISAEMIAAQWNLSRGYLDGWPVSQRRAAAARTPTVRRGDRGGADGRRPRHAGSGHPARDHGRVAVVAKPPSRGRRRHRGNASQISDSSAALIELGPRGRMGLAPAVHTVAMTKWIPSSC